MVSKTRQNAKLLRFYIANLFLWIHNKYYTNKHIYQKNIKYIVHIN